MHVQPIVCLKQQKVIGLEALARPELLTIGEAFGAARQAGCLLDLDRHCRRLALETYASMGIPEGDQPLLFLNFEASIIDSGIVGSGALFEAVNSTGLAPSQVVIEINESLVHNTKALIDFVDTHRRRGFLIALDDLGTGHSNLPRIAQLRPNVIKLDRSLIVGIHTDFFKQETIRSLTRLSRSIGCLVLVEGIETEEELHWSASLGADLFQGYYFGRPAPPQQLNEEDLRPSLLKAVDRVRSQAITGIRQRHATGQRMNWIVEQGCRSLQGLERGQFNTALESMVEKEGGVEAAYLLDENGLQVGETELKPGTIRTNNNLFTPSCRGTDHSMKEYFYSLMGTGLSRFTTDNYISLATGHLCRTVAMWLDHPDGSSYVLCVDLKI